MLPKDAAAPRRCGMVTLGPLTLGADALADIRAYLRIELDEEDPLLLALGAAALRHCEAFVGQVLITRPATERLNVSREWQRLGATPVNAITAVAGIPAEGAPFLLPVDSYAIDIDANGDGWIRVNQPGAAGRVDVTFTAGLANDWAALPEAIRLSAARLTAHLHVSRDGTDDAGPPAAVAALLRPWRRMRLS
jgi:uncharacterized phiE125 gp8 family phage protein